MNELSKYLVENILLEDENPIKKTVVIYVGRFQPFHKGHNATYQHLIKKFGKDNVFIGTSNKTDRLKSPFKFNEKVKIMTTMFGIPKSKIHQVKNPYQPTEILKKFDEKSTAFITVVGEKDKARLGGKYFQPYKGDSTEGYRDRGYVYAAPSQSNQISGTDVRNGLSNGSDEQKKDFFTDTAYTKFNKTIFNLITSKLNEGIEIPKERIEEWLINESSAMIGQTMTDDGPNFMFPNYDVFSKINVDRATKIGYEVVNMITTKELEDYYEHPTYPNGPVKAVTPFPAGVLGAQTATNQVDIYSSDAYSKWFKHVTRKASLVGYSVIGGLDTTKDTKDASLDSQKGDKKSQEEYENSIQEIIKLPVEIGDTLLMGKFKNKKVVVKSIGEDEHGLPTINGKKVVTFRYHKKGPNVFEQFIVELSGTEVKCEKCNHQWEIESDDSEKYLCHSCGWDSQKQEYDFDAFDSWREKMGLTESIIGDLEKFKKQAKDVDSFIGRALSNRELKHFKGDGAFQTFLKKYYLDERGKMRPADRLRRKASMAGKGKEIARKRARTMKRRKPLSKLKKIAYKMAYRQVYAEFSEELYPDINKADLSIAQTQVVHKNVVRKKGRILKRAKFRFLPALRQKENDKFTNKLEELLMGYPDQEWLDNHEKEVHKLRKDFDNEVTPKSDSEYQYGVVKKNMNESVLLNEGGAYGHMNHPFDTEINLTFGQLKDIVNRALEGNLEFTREKTDGQALAVSWVGGRLVAARNKGHLKNKGENALDIKAVADKFKGRGELEKAYNFAMKDMSDSIKSLSSKQREKVFKGGSCFMNLEVIYPTSVNVIPYGQPLLVFHGTMEYNDDGIAIGENADAGRVLAGMIKQINKDVQDNYTIQGPPVIKLPKSQQLSSKKGKYTSQISKLQKEFSLNDSAGVSEYHQAWWSQWVDKNSPSSLDNKTKMGLVKRWAFYDKSFRLDKKNFSDEKTLEWAKKIDKNDQVKISKTNIMKFENIFLGVGADVLEFTSSVLTVNPDEAVRSIKKRIDKTIKDVKKSGDPKKIEKLKLELQRLKAIGGPSKIVPNEGIVFQYKGNTFKLTGAFASVNQLLGIFF